MIFSKFFLSSLLFALLPIVCMANDVVKGKALTEKYACVSCHGADFNKPIDANTPRLAGQYRDYLYFAMKAYQTKGNRLVGRDNPIMASVASNLTTREIQDISAYISQLPGSLKTTSPSGFR